jgi:hypothetical protein
MDSISRLPDAALVQILQHVPLQQRMQSCALVCSTWAAAAVMATTKLALPLAPATVPALQAWLKSGQRAQQLVSLKLERPDRWGHKRMHMACAGLVQLTSLDLDGITPILPRMARTTRSSASGSPTKLVHLELKGLEELARTTTILQLSSLVCLTQLCLSSISLPFSTTQRVKKLSTALEQVLQRLSCLQRLSLHSMNLGAAALAPLSSSSSLVYASLHLARLRSAAVHLPASLTELNCRGWGSRAMLPAQLPQLSGLQRVNLRDGHFYPSVLGSMHHLQQLHIEGCLLPDEQPAAAARAPVMALLDALGCLRKLTSLCIHCINLDCSGVPAQAFSALTVASGLQHLTFDMHDYDAPLGAVQHMFPAGKQLPQLNTLGFESLSDAEPGEGYMTAADVRSIAAACPALERLGLDNALLRHAETGLPVLQSCTSLGVAGLAVGDNAAACIGRLTQLRQLSVRYAPGLTDLGFERLTALQGLTSLVVYKTEGISQPVLAAAMGGQPWEVFEDDEIDFTLSEEVSVS